MLVKYISKATAEVMGVGDPHRVSTRQGGSLQYTMMKMGLCFYLTAPARGLYSDATPTSYVMLRSPVSLKNYQGHFFLDCILIFIIKSTRADVSL